MHLFFSLILILSLNAWGAELKLPALTSPVMDLANLMSEGERTDLSQLAYEINTNGGPQITILTVPDMQGYPIEEYSIRVAEKWQLGTKEKDNGLLVVIAQAEREMRIEVGNGIEGEITDYDTSQYTRRIFPEHFKRGDFHGGIRLFMEDVAQRFNIKFDGAGNAHMRRAPQGSHNSGLGGVVLIGIFVIIFLMNLIRNRNLKSLGSGIGFAGVALIMGLPLAFIFIFFIVGILIGMGGGGGPGGPGRFGPRGFGGRGGFGGGGFGGGGWSGGGGGFSGGGSSGRW